MVNYKKIWDTVFPELKNISNKYGFNMILIEDYYRNNIPLRMALLAPGYPLCKALGFNITLSKYGSILVLPEVDVKIELDSIKINSELLNLIGRLSYSGYISGAMRFKSLDREYPFSIHFTEQCIAESINLLNVGIDAIAVPHLSCILSPGKLFNFTKETCLSSGDNLNVPYLEAALYWLVTYSMLGDLDNSDKELNEVADWLGGQFGVKEEEVSKFHNYGREFLLRSLPKN